MDKEIAMNNIKGIEFWMPVPKPIIPASYVEYIESIPPSPILPCNSPLNSYKCYLELVDKMNRDTQEFWDNEENYTFNEDKTKYLLNR